MFTYRVSTQNDFCYFKALTGPPLQYLLNCKVFVLIFVLTDASSAIIFVYSEHRNVAADEVVLIDVQFADNSTDTPINIQCLTSNMYNIDHGCYTVQNPHQREKQCKNT